MPDLPVDLEALLSPLADAHPAGPNLDLDPAFQALEQCAAGKPERQYGAKVYPAEPPDWTAVQEHALALAARTRDLRVAVWLLRSAAHLQGLPGMATGLELLHGLLRRHWDGVHPQLDASEGNDPTMRLNALAPLANRDAALADLRAAALVNERGSLSLRELELGLGQAQGGPGEVVPTAAGVLKAVAELSRRHPALAHTAARGNTALAGINGLLNEKLGAARAPDLAAFTQLWALLGRGLAGGAAQPGAGSGLPAAAAAGDTPMPTAAPASGLAANALNNRADAQRELERVCTWLEAHEPSHPAPLLIRRAQRLIGMSFIEIIRDLAPDGLSQVERVAGSPASS